jgi:hypothetical protein
VLLPPVLLPLLTTMHRHGWHQSYHQHQLKKQQHQQASLQRWLVSEGQPPDPPPCHSGYPPQATTRQSCRCVSPAVRTAASAASAVAAARRRQGPLAAACLTHRPPVDGQARRPLGEAAVALSSSCEAAAHAHECLQSTASRPCSLRHHNTDTRRNEAPHDPQPPPPITRTTERVGNCMIIA